MKRIEKERHCLEQFQQSINEFQDLWNKLYSVLQNERASSQRLSASMFNNGYHWQVTIKCRPESSVRLSKTVRIGRWTHRWWRKVEEFPNSEIIGQLLYIERHEEQEVHYRLVLDNVTGYERKGLKIFVNIRDVVSVDNLKFYNKRKGNAMEFTANVRTLKRYPSEEKTASL